MSTPLVLTDVWGRVITEQEIRQHMRLFSWKTAATTALLGASLGLGAATRKDNADCSIYEPCTEREKYLESAPFVGAIVGFMVGTQFGRVGRVEAIQEIMAERRGGRR
jgi:hypothetical protein